MKRKPPQITNLHQRISECVKKGHYVLTKHALERQNSRKIDLEDVLHVLASGKHEKRKTTFDDAFQSWKYAIRGKTLDEDDVRVIIPNVFQNLEFGLCQSLKVKGSQTTSYF